MAQRRMEKVTTERMALYAKQHPMMMLLVVVVVVALLFVGVVGSVRARDYGGFLVETHADVSVDDAQGPVRDDGQAAGSPDGGGESLDVEADAVEDVVVVDVAGAVRTPGVVDLPSGSRVVDAIEAAGGLAADADPSSVNRAAVLVDGQQIYIPLQGEAAASSGTDAGSGAGAAASTLININTASVEQLDELPGVGPSTAQAIVDERTASGPFASVEDIMRVSGIGEKKFEKLRNSICV